MIVVIPGQRSDHKGIAVEFSIFGRGLGHHEFIDYSPVFISGNGFSNIGGDSLAVVKGILAGIGQGKIFGFPGKSRDIGA